MTSSIFFCSAKVWAVKKNNMENMRWTTVNFLNNRPAQNFDQIKSRWPHFIDYTAVISPPHSPGKQDDSIDSSFEEVNTSPFFR